MSDVMSVRLHLSGVGVRGVLVDSVDRLEVEVESSREWSRCPHCGFRCRKVWDRRAKRVRDLEVSGRRTTLVWRRRRFECGNCGERHLEDHAQFQRGLTRRFARRLVKDARVMSIRAVARHHGMGWHRIMGLVRAHSAEVAQRRRARPTRVLLVDETSIRRRHRYVTVVACGDTGEVLAMIPGRTKASLARFFRDQGPDWCRQVETVVSDGSRSYQAAISQYLPDARHVLDRFHVARWFTEGLTQVRREIQRRDPERRPPTYEPDLFRARFTLLRRADHLSDAHQAHLDRLFEAHPRLLTAWEALQELYRIYEADDLDGANEALGHFADLYATGQIPEYHQVVDTIIAWGEEILAYHPSRRASNGPLEGINNLLQVLRRVAHGFTNYGNYAARGLLVT
ncbi:MAG: ISL3 family transposase [bacterium]|nr:ISL3 family transposase [bacterium]MDE0288584.1 ISL3 family transposase [bacterium]MDE0440361.1 ISL3 family transposase [bacterium]